MSLPMCKLMSPLFTIMLLGVAAIATLFQVIAFGSHSWAVWTEFRKDASTSVLVSVETRTGLWYSVICQTGDCETISHLSDYIESKNNGLVFKEVQYALRTWSETLATLALVASIVAVACSVPFLCKSENHKRLHLAVCISSFISGLLLLSVVTNWGCELGANKVVFANENMQYEFPWSLFIAGLGGLVEVVLGIAHLVLLCIALKASTFPGENEFKPGNAYIQLTTQYSQVSQFSNNSENNDSVVVLNKRPSEDCNNLPDGIV